jgi:cytochrome c-type biogenesis protein CcmE
VAVTDTPSSDEMGPDAGPAITLGGPRRRRSLGTRRQRVVALLVIAAALGFLLFRGLTNATEYFKTTTEAVNDRTQLGTSDFRIEGTVENDVRKTGDETDFTIYGGGTAVNVISTGSPSELFKPGIPVVLDGHWAATGNTYLSDLIMVKHTASYVEAHPSRLKSQLPATSTGSSGGQ